MGQEIKDAELEAAAAWWIERVVAPKFDNGDSSPASALAASIAAQTVGKSPSADTLSAFAGALKRLIRDQFATTGYVHLGVDYHPFGPLEHAAVEAGIPLERFPWKTSMWIERDSLTVQSGYRAPRETIWASSPPSATPSLEQVTEG